VGPVDDGPDGKRDRRSRFAATRWITVFHPHRVQRLEKDRVVGIDVIDALDSKRSDIHATTAGL